MNPNNKKTAKIIEKPVDIAFTFTKRKIQIAYFEFVTIKEVLRPFQISYFSLFILGQFFFPFHL